MRIYFDVIFNTLSWSISNPAVFYPFLIVLSLSILGALVFLIRYLVRGS